MNTILIIGLAVIAFIWWSHRQKESEDFEDTTYNNPSENLTIKNVPNIQWDKYDVVDGHLVKKQIVKTEITDDKFNGDIIYANEASPYIEGTEHDFPKYPDTIMLLLNKDGKVTDLRDLLFYGSKDKDYIEVRGGQGKAPISKDNAILGPMAADDFWCNFRIGVGLDYTEMNEMCFLCLDKIDSNIKTIVLAHFNYNFNKERMTFSNQLYLHNYIVGLKVDMHKNGWHKINSFAKQESRGCKEYVSDSFKIDHFAVCYTSAKFVRNDDGTWSYVPLRKQYDDVMKLFEAYVDNTLFKGRFG